MNTFTNEEDGKEREKIIPSWQMKEENEKNPNFQKKNHFKNIARGTTDPGIASIT